LKLIIKVKASLHFALILPYVLAISHLVVYKVTLIRALHGLNMVLMNSLGHCLELGMQIYANFVIIDLATEYNSIRRGYIIQNPTRATMSDTDKCRGQHFID